MKRVILLIFLLFPVLAQAQANFNPNFIISDSELTAHTDWTRNDVQQFLDSKGSYLSNYVAPDASGTPKYAADIIVDAANTYKINPKFLLVTLQKEQSLITDDSPSDKQLNWATGYAVCDSCSMNDPAIQSHKGFGNQVDNAAGLMRWYYDNKDVKSFIKKKDTPVIIDGTTVVPQSWATAFLYTYTPHLHGNNNFWRIWDTWFGQIYPNGSILKNASTSEIWLLQNSTRRKFKNQTILITRADPKMIITVPETVLNNYVIGPEISFANYSLLKVNSHYYLLDYDTLRPFESAETVRLLGYNPDEIIDATNADIANFNIGTIITASSSAPAGVIYQVAGLTDPYFLLKDGVLYSILDKRVVEANFRQLKVEKKTLQDLAKYPIANELIKFVDGTLIKDTDFNAIYVIDNGKKRKIADSDTFQALGYKKENIIEVNTAKIFSIPSGETLYLNSSLLSNKDKFLGDSEAVILDLYASKLPGYLIAEYPSGRIISGKNIDVKRPIASLTKLLASYQALSDGLNLKKSTTYQTKSHSSYGNPLSLINGEKLLNRDIIFATLVGSVNNAARMLATAAGKTESTLVDEINQTLATWGADATTITEPTGLETTNVSTARDLLKIFIKIQKNATIKEALAQTNYTFKEALNKNKISSHTIKNTNNLITQSGRSYRILASKTGYIEECGSNLIMLIEGRTSKKQYVIITLGESDYKNRFRESNRLAEQIIKYPPISSSSSTKK